MLTINLTTTSERFELCSATLWSLLHQDRLPDKICLWVSKEPYLADKGVDVLPSCITDLLKFSSILEVKFVENIGPYRKIIPALRNASDSEVIVYADDDVIYGKKWLLSLENTFIANKTKFIVASRIRIIKKNIFGINQNYNMYPIYFGDKSIKSNFIITGVGGCILMKKHISELLINDDSFMSIAPKADDLWISKIIEVSGTEVKSCLKALDEVQEINHSISCLSHNNTIYFRGATFMAKAFYRFHGIVFGYFGLAKSNNDITFGRIHKYFHRDAEKK
ncbi:glycosyltransferase family 2 protein [Pluralibacter gergoviae]|nr:glycosyltransferase [Pluralibacter gergoviae]